SDSGPPGGRAPDSLLQFTESNKLDCEESTFAECFCYSSLSTAEFSSAGSSLSSTDESASCFDPRVGSEQFEENRKIFFHGAAANNSFPPISAPSFTSFGQKSAEHIGCAAKRIRRHRRSKGTQ